MIVETSPAFASVATSVRPEDLLLRQNSWVKFTGAWPDNHDWATDRVLDQITHKTTRIGKVFTVTQAVLVPVPYSYLLPGSDYKKLDLSNSSSGLKLYPEDELVIYEIAVGMKKGDYILHIYIPTNKYVFALADSTMSPDVTDDDYRFVGARQPSDSPADHPLLKMYAIKDMAAFQLWLYALKSVAYEQATLQFYVNKCRLSEILNPLPEQRQKAMTIEYFTEMTGF